MGLAAWGVEAGFVEPAAVDSSTGDAVTVPDPSPDSQWNSRGVYS
jgi:hypothetical protein